METSRVHWLLFQLWGWATVVSVALCWKCARQLGYSGALYAFMALLVGPGALPLTRLATAEPPSDGQCMRQQLGLALVAMVAGFSVCLSLLTCSLFAQLYNCFDGHCVEWPGPTLRLLSVLKALRNPLILFPWMGLNLALPVLLYRWCGRWAHSLLEGWTWTVSLSTLPLFVFTLISWGAMEPFYYMEGCIDDSPFPRLTTGVWVANCLLAAFLCAIRAAAQGYSARIFAALGLMLGLGALPLTFLATKNEVVTHEDGTGFNPEVTSDSDRQENGRQIQKWRHLMILVTLGLGGGLVAYAGQVFLLSYYILGLFMDSGIHELLLHHHDRHAQLIWTLVTLVAPTILYRLLGYRTPPSHLPPAALPAIMAIYFTAASLACWGALKVYLIV